MGNLLCFFLYAGVYLPLLWEQSFCVRTPIALGYTRGHFSALVPMEPETHPHHHHLNQHHGNIDTNDSLQITFLPLMDRDRKILPVHFLTQVEVNIIVCDLDTHPNFCLNKIRWDEKKLFFDNGWMCAKPKEEF